MASAEEVKVLGHYRVAPPLGGAPAEFSLPLTFFDLPFLHHPLIHHIIFHDYFDFTPAFINEVVPKLKHSLSLTLKHYFPFAGSLIFPSNSRKPEIFYVEGDTVSLTFVESSQDFNHLTGNHARNADEFHPLVPKMPPVSFSSGKLVAPLLAIKVTLFPNSGVCVGFTIRRVVADGNACTRFIRSWASIMKNDGEANLITDGCVPFYDRCAINDMNKLDTTFWDQVGKKKFQGAQPEYVPTNKVRSTFILGQPDVQRLKKLVTAQRPSLKHVSTFTVTCGYVWSCMVLSRAAVEEGDPDESEHFVFGADCRSLLNPPVPENYFGNCLINCIATLKTSQLASQDGFVIAAETIGEAIRRHLHSKDGVLNDAEKWVADYEALNQRRIVGVAGSPKFAVYDMDFWLGKPRKSEVVSIDITGSMSLNECRDTRGDMEVGLSMPRPQMDAFASIFSDGLKVN